LIDRRVFWPNHPLNQIMRNKIPPSPDHLESDKSANFHRKMPSRRWRFWGGRSETLRLEISPRDPGREEKLTH
jgi:hypothetical protein